MLKYLIRDNEAEDSFIEINDAGTAIAYNNYSKKSHNVTVIDEDGNYLIKVKCQGKTKTIRIPMYALQDLENISRCLRDAHSNLGYKNDIYLLVKEVE